MDWSTSKAQHMCRFLSKEEWRQPLVKIIQCPASKRHIIIIIISSSIIIIIQEHSCSLWTLLSESDGQQHTHTYTHTHHTVFRRTQRENEVMRFGMKWRECVRVCLCVSQ